MAKVVYEVLEGRTVICSREMHLTKQQAQNKVDNEKRYCCGSEWSIRPVRIPLRKK